MDVHVLGTLNMHSADTYCEYWQHSVYLLRTQRSAVVLLLIWKWDESQHMTFWRARGMVDSVWIVDGWTHERMHGMETPSDSKRSGFLQSTVYSSQSPWPWTPQSFWRKNNRCVLRRPTRGDQTHPWPGIRSFPSLRVHSRQDQARLRQPCH